MANKRGHNPTKHFLRMPRRWPKRYYAKGFGRTMNMGEEPFAERNVRLLLKRDTERNVLEYETEWCYDAREGERTP